VSRKTSIKPITYMKTHAADILAAVSETREAIVITHNGEGKMVIQDIDTYESNRQTIAMLKLAALGQKSVESGDVKPARKAFEDIETRRKSRRG
jgi:prevent-host-death family protein